MSNLANLKNNFDQHLQLITSKYFSEKSILNSAITYSLTASGKRIRPLLVLAFSEMFHGKKDVALNAATAVEMIHCYSLIHDDLPAMDNDDFRRGIPTNHKVYGEAQAILAGDSLLNLAPEMLIKELTQIQYPAGLTLKLVSKLLEASGHMGMIKGQSLDIEFESKEISFHDPKELGHLLQNIHKLKTGAIITWSALAGLYSSSNEELILKYNCPIISLGNRIGLLFQVVDDIIDVISSFEDLGKTPGKDQVSGKLTYTSLYGLEGAKSMAKDLENDIRSSLEEFQSLGFKTQAVVEILETILSKMKI